MTDNTKNYIFENTRFFHKQHFYTQHQAELGKTSAKY